MRVRRYWLCAWMCVMVLALSPESSAQPFRVVAGQLDSERDGVVARAGGATVRLAKGLRLRLAPGTKLYRVHKQTRLWLSNDGRTHTHIIALASGRMDVESDDADRAIMVSAPLAVTSFVRGGRMHVAARSDQVSIANLDGSVKWAKKTWKFAALEPGKVRTLSRLSDGESAILAAPRVQLENHLFGAFGQGAALSGVAWEPVPDAVGYRVHIEQLEPERGVLRSVETAGAVLSPAPQLPPGRYALTVQAVDRHGIEGRVSAPEHFGVVGVRTNDGGYVDAKGNIVAGYDWRVQLTHAQGLLLKSGQLDWSPVPEEIVLTSAEPMTLHMRQAGDTRLVSARVRAPHLEASVSVGPKYVRWPGDSVLAEVKLEGPEGGGVPDWVRPRFRVLLGIDEIEVGWTRNGDSFVAEVPPQGGEGPWVVRVEVEDQYGHLLGRDFVEITERLPPEPLAPVPAPARASR